MAEGCTWEVDGIVELGVSGALYGVEVQWGENIFFGKPT